MANKLKVIIVDDDNDIVENLKIILTVKGDINVVGTANNGEEALLLLDEVQADIAIIDLQMPVMSGTQLIRALKVKHPSIKKLVYTTFSEDKDIAEAIINGADSYITKDISDKLLHSIMLLAQGQSIFDRRVVEWLRKCIKQPKSDELISSDVLFKELTNRELYICEILSNGFTNKEIAKQLFISEGTVKNYISSIYDKTGIHDRTQLVIALQKNLTIKLSSYINNGK
jgi:DNA-binding NarL/FixJ family response regulator